MRLRHLMENIIFEIKDSFRDPNDRESCSPKIMCIKPPVDINKHLLKNAWKVI